MSAPAARTGLFPIGPTSPRSFSIDSAERSSTAKALEEVRGANYEVAHLIGGREVRTGRTEAIVTPHQHARTLGQFHHAGPTEAGAAIEAATTASGWWSRLSWEERAAPFLRAADMLEYGPWRDRLNAATMLELSKTTYQADIDAACETVDFIRINVKNMLAMYDVQPGSLPGMWNQAEYRPLEGFVFAVSPFNFTCMNNLAFGPAVLGNTVVWKPAESASLVAHLSMQLLCEA
ncbi:MAG: 1-pyrroline-5-carboxylate dehydrogenase, partial [Frankiales bacterium]|nr:1-pyrroline-5-carboxylate dehydrogenase [Frankiales bacterium]